MKYQIEISEDGQHWFKPHEVDSRLNSVEPTLNHAIKAERFFQRMFGLQTRRTEIAA